MEPLTAGVIATLIATKAFEKTGEKLSEGVWNQVSKFLDSLKQKDPRTAEAIQQVAQQPTLAEQYPQEYGTKVLISKVEAAIQTDPLVRQTAEAVQTAVQDHSSTVQNSSKLADKIGILVQGGSPQISIDTLNI